MEPIDLDSYRLGPQAGREEPRTPLSWATFALDRANALAQFVPFIKPRNVYANPRGGGNLRFRPASDLAAGGAAQTDDTFLLDIQFANVRFKNPSATGDPVENYGPTFSLFDFMDMLQSGSPDRFYQYLIGLHSYDAGTMGQGGEGTPTPLPAGTKDLMDLLAAPSIAAEIKRLMSEGLPPALVRPVVGGPTGPHFEGGGIKKGVEDGE